ncbi:AAA ATPase [Photobacterium aphoticum]|uniref:AAA ATPase n=1 Tax=Photobacterium aphoticum TaxID=754436 RepID=A0A090QQ17_9GAMM|nr:AAA ATPase [Photobacterium aphoticum]
MYEAYFGFTDKPFRLSPDPRFFFASPHHEKAASYLQYGLSSGEGFIVVTGPIGSGKTMIARHLLANLDDSVVAVQIATTCLSPDELVRLVAAKFDIPVEGLSKADILKRLEQCFLSLHAKGLQVLLLVDEAQNLPPETVEELRMLSNFQQDDKPLLQSFLLGQEELKAIIARPDMEQFRQRVIASCHLQSFDCEQTQEYIEHRLQQVGWEGKPALNEAIFSMICEQTAGIPRKINILMDRVLLFAFLEEMEEVDEDAISQVLAEMGEEFSGALSSSSMGEVNRDNAIGSDEGAARFLPQRTWSDQEAEKLLNTLDNVTEVLDKVIERKIATIRYLDTQIIKKRRLYQATVQSEPMSTHHHHDMENSGALAEDESILGDDDEACAPTMTAR